MTLPSLIEAIVHGQGSSTVAQHPVLGLQNPAVCSPLQLTLQLVDAVDHGHISARIATCLFGRHHWATTPTQRWGSRRRPCRVLITTSRTHGSGSDMACGDTTSAGAGDTEHAVDGALAPVNKLCGRGAWDGGGWNMSRLPHLSTFFWSLKARWDLACQLICHVMRQHADGLLCRQWWVFVTGWSTLDAGTTTKPAYKSRKLLSVNDCLRKVHQGFYHFF
jgi:hypothetical protein